jgi:phosphoribosylformylglycinamidine cyclo-ligase
MLTYKKSGVDIDKANNFVSWIKAKVPSIGFFSGFYKINNKQTIVGSCDGVGTKLKVAQLVNKHNTIGIDLVAMNVNDIIVCGAKPIFFLDYIAVGKLNLNIMKNIMEGIIDGCKIAGCNLMGGETAEMPDMYKNGEYDLAGFACGIVNEKDIIKGRDIKDGDILIGIKSSGLHSNGYSLVRKVFSEQEQKKYAKILLVPTKIYVKTILALLKKFKPNKDIKALVHITGGGFYDNIVRVLPKSYKAVIYKNLWSVPEIFKIIQQKGKIELKEMYRTFNMGIGMVIVVNKNKVEQILQFLGKESVVIGKIEKSDNIISEVLII